MGTAGFAESRDLVQSPMVGTTVPWNLIRSPNQLYHGQMGTNPAADQVARLLVEREEVLLRVRELEALLDRSRRQLDDMNAEISSLRRVEGELLRRHPELEQQ